MQKSLYQVTRIRIDFNWFCLKVFCILIFCTLQANVFAGSIHGRILNKRTHEIVSGVTISVTNTHLSTISDFSGNFFLDKLPAGRNVLVCKAIGYRTDTIPVIIKENEPITLSVLLEKFSERLPGVTIHGIYLDKGSEKNAQLIQAASIPIVDIVSEEAIARTSDLNIAEVSRRVNGLSVSTENSGESVKTIIRGMDPKYNYTLVNGFKIPSPADRARYVPLSFFPAAMVQRVDVYKSLTPDMEGDAIGGVVNLVLRNAPKKPILKLNLQTGYNSFFFNQPYLSFNRHDIQKKSPYELLGSGYYAQGTDFTKNNLSFSNTRPGIDAIGSLIWGRRFSNNKLGLLVSLDHQNIKIGNSNFFIPQNNEPQVNNAPGLTDFYLNQYSTTKIRENIHATLDYTFKPGNTITFYQFYTSEKDIESRNRVDTSLTQGRSVPGTGSIFISNRSRLHIERLYSASLLWNVKVSKQVSLSVPVAYSIASGLYPDWSELSARTSLIENPNGQIVQEPLLLQPLTRIWLRNKERDIVISPRIDYHFTFKKRDLLFSVGGLFWDKHRDNFYNEYTFQPAITSNQGQPFTDIYQAVWTNNNGPQNPLGDVANPNTYTANEDISAAFFSVKIKSNKTDFIGGIRYEGTKQHFQSSVNPSVTYGKEGKINYADFLPSLQYKYSLNDKSSVRASLFKSISRPALYDITFYSLQYEDYTEAGNPFLLRAKAANADLRYELHANELDELVVGAFYKHIIHPYERTLLNSGDVLYLLPQQGLSYTPATTLTAQVKNSANADVYGFEFAGEKYFGKIGLQGSYTYTYSRITQATKFKTREDPANTASNIITITKYQSRPLQGQSAHLANFGVLYKDNHSGLTARMSAIYTGRRIYSSSGWYGLDYWQRGYWIIDGSIDKKLGSRFKMYVKSNNIFNTRTIVELLQSNPSYASALIPGQQSANRITVMRQTDFTSYFVGVYWSLQ
jgi:hypothetical protein